MQHWLSWLISLPFWKEVRSLRNRASEKNKWFFCEKDKEEERKKKEIKIKKMDTFEPFQKFSVTLDK